MKNIVLFFSVLILLSGCLTMKKQTPTASQYYKLKIVTLEKRIKEMQDKILFKAKVLNTEKRLRAYIDHKKSLPFVEDELSDKELATDKRSCINEYNKYKNKDQDLLTSTK